MNANYYITHLNMQQHPEGGHYKETYRNAQTMIFDGFENGPRSLCTSIYYLLQQGEYSALHRVKSDELWYHHDGGCLVITEMDEAGKEIITRLGKNVETGEVLQHVVKAGRWFGAKPAEGTEFCLTGCQMSPGFDFRDFELKEQP